LEDQKSGGSRYRKKKGACVPQGRKGVCVPGMGSHMGCFTVNRVSFFINP